MKVAVVVGLLLWSVILNSTKILEWQVVEDVTWMREGRRGEETRRGEWRQKEKIILQDSVGHYTLEMTWLRKHDFYIVGFRTVLHLFRLQEKSFASVQVFYPVVNNFIPFIILYTLDILIYQKHKE